MVYCSYEGFIYVHYYSRKFISQTHILRGNFVLSSPTKGLKIMSLTLLKAPTYYYSLSGNYYKFLSATLNFVTDGLEFSRPLNIISY